MLLCCCCCCCLVVNIGNNSSKSSNSSCELPEWLDLFSVRWCQDSWDGLTRQSHFLSRTSQDPEPGAELGLSRAFLCPPGGEMGPNLNSGREKKGKYCVEDKLTRTCPSVFGWLGGKFRFCGVGFPPPRGTPSSPSFPLITVSIYHQYHVWGPRVCSQGFAEFSLNQPRGGEGTISHYILNFFSPLFNTKQKYRLLPGWCSL